MIIIDNILQGSSDWMALRRGNPGASSISRIITTSGSPSKQAEEYKYHLASEIISGRHEETFQSSHMVRGLEMESEARELFELITDTEVRQVAIVYKDEQKRFHCSPDGLINENAGLEVKCLMGKNHIKYLLANKLPTEFFSQIQMSLYTCEREFWFFMSYYPMLEPLIIKVQRDEVFIARLKKELDRFCMELAVLVQRLREGNKWK